MPRGRFRSIPGPALATLGGIALMLLVGLGAGQDYNYDLENYHFVSAHLLLTGGLDRNVAPSGVQSWFNPIGYVPVMLGIKLLPPLVVAALMAAAAGLNAPLIYMLADRIAAGFAAAERKWIALLCTLIGMTGAVTQAEAATSFLDNLLSIAQLGALVLTIGGLDRAGPARSRWIGGAGLLLGIASGIKLTVAIFAVAMTMALLVIALSRRIGLPALLAYAGGGVAGFLLTGGWWAWHLWSDFGNPVFPMANDLFHSPWAPQQPLNDTSFQPKHWTDALTNPWHWLIGDVTPGAEVRMRDPRYAVAMLAAMGGLAWSRLRRAGRGPDDGGRMIVLLFVPFAYGVWLFVFGILRYAVVLEMLSGVALLAALTVSPRISPRACRGALFGFALLALAWTQSGIWGRAAFGGDWFGVRGIEAVHRDGTVYVMPDDAPLGFLIPLFPADARFVHIGGNFPLDPQAGLGRRGMVMIRQAPILRTLAAAPDSPAGVAALDRFGLAEVPGSCRPIRTKVAPAESCLLARTH